eukprot:scaffold4391_cov164-Ochromonas_danica.AAC.3
MAIMMKMLERDSQHTPSSLFSSSLHQLVVSQLKLAVKASKAHCGEIFLYTTPWREELDDEDEDDSVNHHSHRHHHRRHSHLELLCRYEEKRKEQLIVDSKYNDYGNSNNNNDDDVLSTSSSSTTTTSSSTSTVVEYPDREEDEISMPLSLNQEVYGQIRLFRLTSSTSSSSSSSSSSSTSSRKRSSVMKSSRKTVEIVENAAHCIAQSRQMTVSNQIEKSLQTLRTLIKLLQLRLRKEDEIGREMALNLLVQADDIKWSLSQLMNRNEMFEEAMVEESYRQALSLTDSQYSDNTLSVENSVNYDSFANDDNSDMSLASLERSLGDQGVRLDGLWSVSQTKEESHLIFNDNLWTDVSMQSWNSSTTTTTTVHENENMERDDENKVEEQTPQDNDKS